MNVFDIVGESYFTVLSSKNRKVYLDSILYLNSLINDLFEANENDKEKIVELLADHLSEKYSVKIIDEYTDDEVENIFNNTDRARYILNVLINYGWLIEESVSNGRKALDFTDYSYRFIDLIKEIGTNNKPSYTSHIKIIKNELDNFKVNDVDSLEIINRELKAFVSSLRGLHSSLQRFYKHITNNKTKEDLINLLEEFTGEYRDYFFDSSYYKLKVTDNVSFMLPVIKERIEEILNDESSEWALVASRQDNEYNYEQANKYVMDAKRDIFNNLEIIPTLIEMIDNKNNMYITRTINVVMHLINRGEDVEGLLNRLITLVKDNKTEDNFISLFQVNHYSFDYLTTPRKKSTKTLPEMLSLDTSVDQEVEEKAIAMLKEEQKYNIDNVNKYVLNFLANSSSKEIKELDIKSNYEYIMIISIVMHSKMMEAFYEIEFLDEVINTNKVSFNNFIIKLKG